jgi:hemerythrin-like domain-containing protein
MTLPNLDDLAARSQAAKQALDPTALLLAEHEWLRSLLDYYRTPVRQNQSLGDVHAAILALKPRLDLHIRCEEDAYFPAVEEFMQESGQGSTFDMYGEHDAIRIRLEQLLTALGNGRSAADAYSAFSRSLTVHFENEEELIFAEAPAHLSEAARREILAKFDALAV